MAGSRKHSGRIWSSVELKGYIEFPHHQQVVRIERSVTDLAGNPLRHEVVSGITSLTPEKAGPERLLKISREHWGIETSLHWRLDIAFREDESRIRKGNGAENFAILRHIALNLLNKEDTAKIGMKNKRLKAGWDASYLEKVLAGLAS